MVSQQEEFISILLLATLTVLAVVLVLDDEDARDVSDSEEELLRLVHLVTTVSVRVKRLRDGDDADLGPRRKRTVVNYDHQRAAECVNDDYWGPYPRFADRQFERFFRITRAFADRILTIAANTDAFFTKKEDALGKPGICPKVKVLMGLKCMAYGVSPSAFMDYFQMGETTGRECVKRLARVVANHQDFTDKYRRAMKRTDARKLSDLHRRFHGVAGMIGSLDCMHVGWRLCLVAWQGAYKGAKGKPTIVLEAVTDYNLWIWHVSFGSAGTNNDINIWDRSPLLKSFLEGSFAKEVDFEFRVGDQTFNQLWMMVDGIYPELARFVKPLSEPLGRRETKYAAWQESSRKDVERGFGVLQRKFHILVHPFELWFRDDIANIVHCCVVLHNMMVEERVSRSEIERAGFYELSNSEDDLPLEGDEAEETVGRQIAELNIIRRIEEAFFANGTTLPLHERVDVNLLQMTELHAAAQRRWDKLYDGVAHMRLRHSIMDQLQLTGNDHN